MTSIENKIYVGIDVSKALLDVHILNKNHHFQFDNTDSGFRKLLTKIKKYQKELVHIALESTGGYEKPAARFLAENDYMVSIINPRMIRNFAKAGGKLAKTDKVDARIIANYCHKMEPTHRVKIDKKHDKIAELTARRDQLVAMIISEKNRLEKSPIEIKRSIIKILKVLKKELAEIERKLKKAVKADERYAEIHALLESIKGIGPTTATALIAHLPEIGSLSNKQAGALAGLAPFNCDSGKYKGERKIWGGRKEIRNCLYMAAMAAVRSNRVIRDFYNKLVNKGKNKMVALTACMRKLLLIANAMVRKNQPWQANFGLVKNRA